MVKPLITLMINILITKGKKVLRIFRFSKADKVFFFYTWWCVLPVFAMPPAHPPEMDPLLKDLQSRFVMEARLVPLELDGLSEVERSKKEKEHSYVITGEILPEHGMSQERGDRYTPTDQEKVVGSLVIRQPTEAYIEHKGLYHGYRLFFGNGYIVPSLLFKKTKTQDTTSDFMEVFPVTGALKDLKELREHAYESGVHVLGLFLFPFQGQGRAQYDPQTFSKQLSLEDRLEKSPDPSQAPSAFPEPLKPFKTEKIHQSLKKKIQQGDVNTILTQWLYALAQEEHHLQELGYRQSTEALLSAQTLKDLAFKSHKLMELSKSPYALSYEDAYKLIHPPKRKHLPEKKTLPRPLKEITLLTLYDLFFKHAHQDWTKTFELMGETFSEYAPYFSAQKHLFQDQRLLKQALDQNRGVGVLRFMRSGGLRTVDSNLLGHLVRVSGQKLETPKAIQWLKELKKMGMPLDQEDEKGQTSLDLALLQQKHKIVKELIQLGAGSRVKPHLIIDYLDQLRGHPERSSPKQVRRLLSKKLSQQKKGKVLASAQQKEEEAPNQREFEELLDILEFRNHQLRWRLMLESLLPLNIGQEGLKVKTTDQNRVLHPEFVDLLWTGGNPQKPKTFQSFTETEERDQRKYGRRTVGRITDGRYTLYVKQYPELPGIEEAVGFFTRQILGYGAPNTLLANIHGTAYLFSEGIVGRPLHDYLTGQTSIPWRQVQQKLDPEALSGMIVLAMLTNPEDGKPDNYIVQETPSQTYRIIGETIKDIKKTSEKQKPFIKKELIYTSQQTVVTNWQPFTLRKKD